MSKALIIAAHEVRYTVGTRGFWIQLLMVPLILVVATAVPRLAARQLPAITYVIIDQEGDVAEPLANLLQRRPTGAALNTNQPMPMRVPGLPNIDVDQEPALLAPALAPYLKGEIKLSTNDGARVLSVAIVVPHGFGAAPEAPVRVLSVHPVQAAFLQQLRSALGQILRARTLTAHGVDPTIVSQVERIVAPITVLDPTKRGSPPDPSADIIGAIAPIAFSMLLFMSVFTVGTRLLFGVIEERSNKLVEVILSSVTPGQFMIGKLVGIGIVGIIVILTWIGAASLLLGPASGSAGIIVALSRLLDAKMAAAFILYFLAAYVMYAALFLGIGSVANSPRDAQPYLQPLTFIAVLPLLFLTPMSLAPNGPLAVAMSWIPLYTPFTMMLRLPAHPPLWQVIGTAAVMLAFIAFLLWMLGRLFRVSILSTGATMRPGEVWRALIGSDS